MQLLFADCNGFETCVGLLKSFALPFVDKSLENRPATVGPLLPHVTPPGFPQHVTVNSQQCQNRGLPIAPSQYSGQSYLSALQGYLAQPYPVSNNVTTNWVPSSAQPVRTMSRQSSLTYHGSQEDRGALDVQSQHHHALMSSNPATHTQSIRSLEPAYCNVPVSSQNSQQGSLQAKAGRLPSDIATNGFQHQANDHFMDWRPSSAPKPHTNQSGNVIGVLGDMLPPVRELPFPEKRAKTASRTIDVTSKLPSESTLKPKATKKVTKPCKKATNTKKASSVQSKLPEPTSKPGTSLPKSRRSRAKPDAKKANHVPSSSAPPKIGQMKSKIKSKPPAVEIATAPTTSPFTPQIQDPAGEKAEKPKTHILSPKARIASPKSSSPRTSLAENGVGATPQDQDSLAKSSREVSGGSQIALTQSEDKVVAHADTSSMDPSTASSDTTDRMSNVVGKSTLATRALTKIPSSDPPSRAQAQIEEPVLTAPSIPQVTLADATTQTPARPLAESPGNTQHCKAPEPESDPEYAANPFLSTMQPKEYLSSIEDWIRGYQHLPFPQPPVTAKDQMAEYASKPDAERARMISNQICECFQDENFRQLAKDVEGNWKRMCLGF